MQAIDEAQEGFHGRIRITNPAAGGFESPAPLRRVRKYQAFKCLFHVHRQQGEDKQSCSSEVLLPHHDQRCSTIVLLLPEANGRLSFEDVASMHHYEGNCFLTSSYRLLLLHQSYALLVQHDRAVALKLVHFLVLMTLSGCCGIFMLQDTASTYHSLSLSDLVIIFTCCITSTYSCTAGPTLSCCIVYLPLLADMLWDLSIFIYKNVSFCDNHHDMHFLLSNLIILGNTLSLLKLSRKYHIFSIKSCSSQSLLSIFVYYSS